MKKVILIIVFLFCVFYSINGECDIYEPVTKFKSKERLVDVTSPKESETTIGNGYVICGATSENGISTKFLRYDKYKRKYVDFKTIDGFNEWIINKAGIFMKEIRLPYEGANKIRFVFYKDNEIAQIKDFTITVIQDNMKEYIKSSLYNFSDMMWYLSEK